MHVAIVGWKFFSIMEIFFRQLINYKIYKFMHQPLLEDRLWQLAGWEVGYITYKLKKVIHQWGIHL